MNGFLIFSTVLYLVSFISSITVIIIDLRLSKKILKREGEFNSKINFLNSAYQSNKDSIENLKGRINTFEKELEKLNSKINELETKKDKGPIVKVNKTSNKDSSKTVRPSDVKKKTILKKVVKNKDNKVESNEFDNTVLVMSDSVEEKSNN